MKIYIKNNSLPILILFACGLLFTGCKKFLDVDRQGSYTADDYPYPGGSGPYDQFIFGAYNDLRNYWISADGLVTTTSIRSDDADKGDSPAGGAIEMDNFTVLPNSSRCNLTWTSFYGLINKCNSTIANVDTIKTIVASDAIKLQSKAEVKFMRAYSYFMLVRLFGKVPIIDTVYADPLAQQIVPQSSVEAIYTFIENDLNDAINYLPLEWDKTKFAGRITRGAAQGLLAKVYLTQKKWALAMTAAQSVMNSGVYNLSTPYATIFSEDGENSKESLFEVQATASATVTEGNGVQYASIQGVRAAGVWNNGWGWNIPTLSLEAAYEAGDPRKARTILYASTATTTNFTVFGEAMPVYPGGTELPRYNHKVLGNPAMRNSISRGGWWINVRILRYADVVLMFAEAANELGGDANITAARTALNSVRIRARGTTTGVLPNITVTEQAALRDAIWRERRVELAMEHDRFFDLVRWGVAAEVMQAHGKTGFIAGKHELLPIPLTQIDLSKNVLKQNTGY